MEKVEKLRKLIKKAGNEYEIEEEEYEYEIRNLIIQAYLTPQCCDAQKTHPSAYWSLDYSWPKYKHSKKATGTWKSRIDFQELNDFFRRKFSKNSMDWYESRPEPKFCTYCGENLPNVIKKKKFPKNTSVIKKDGDYCDTCDERLRNCICYPPEYAWKIEVSSNG